MWFRVFVFLAFYLTLLSFASAETIIDASKEWQLHASSSPSAERIPGFSGSAPTPDVVAPSSYTVSDDPSCECESLTPKERLEQSTLAFTGIVSEATKPKQGKRTVVFDVDEIFKGTPDAEAKVMVDISGTSCDLPFLVGQSYLVFTHWEWGKMMTSRCLGTKFLEKAKVSALGPDQERKEKLYIGLRNMCMGRRDTSCCLSSLKAMRQGYYVPEPEEGCQDGSVPDRLHCGGSYTWCIPFTDKGHQEN